MPIQSPYYQNLLQQLSGGSSSQLATTPDDAVITPVEKLTEFASDEGGVLAICYGKHLIAGTLIAKKFTSGSPNESIILVALGEGQGEGGEHGEWDDAINVWYAGEALNVSPDASTEGYRFYPGTISTGIADSTQGVDPFLPNGITYSGTAYVAAKLPSAYTGEDRSERLRGLYKGKRTFNYDEAGGETDYGYSVNPARVAADRIRVYYEKKYRKDLTRARSKFRDRVNWPLWVAWRNYNDEQITWDDGIVSNRQIPRFECHISFAQDLGLADALNQICATAAAFWQDDGNQLNFYGPALRDPIHHFDPSNIVDNGPPKLSKVDIRERPNWLTAKYRDLYDPFLAPAVTPPVRADDLIAKIGVIKESQPRQFANMLQSQAQRLLNRQLRIESLNPTSCPLTGKPSSLHVLPGDLVTVSHPVPRWDYQLCLVVTAKLLSNEERADETEFVLQKIETPFLYSDLDHSPLQEALTST